MLGLLRRYRELILIAILLVVPLGVFFAHAKRPAERSRFDRAVVWVATPVEKALAWAVTGTLKAWSGYVALRGARERSVELSRQLRYLELERQQLMASRGEAERLRKLLAFTEEPAERRYLGARVIGIRLGVTGQQLLTVDQGSDHGVSPMMPVLVAEGVVGRVHSVSASSSDVLVLTDLNSSVAVRVERTRARANVRGLGKPDLCRLDYALRTEDMIEGDPLVTSGTDGVFPRGLPVGKVTQLDRRGRGLFQDARVVPAVDVTRLEEVLILTAWEQPAEAAPAALAPGKLE